MKKNILIHKFCFLVVLTVGFHSSLAQNAIFADHGFIPGFSSPASQGAQTALYNDQYVFVATDDGIWKNNINTREWTEAGLRGVTINCIFKHPTIANKLFAGGYINADPNFPTPNRAPLYISNNGGISWTPVTGSVNENYYCFAVRPDHPNHIYANVEGQNIAISVDGGNNWTFMNNRGGGSLGYQSIIAFLPNNANKIFQGAEAPLDDAWLGRYDINITNPIMLENFTKIVKGQFTGGPWENRRPNKLMTYNFTGNTIYVGQEGALSKVKDTVATYIYRAEEGQTENPYSYIKGIWVDPLDTNHIIFGGGLNNITQPMQVYETYNEGRTVYRYTDKFGIENPVICDMVELGNNRIAVVISDKTSGNYRVKLLVMQPEIITALRNKISEEQVWVSPNPSNDVIRLDYKNATFSSLDVKIFNLFGHQVYEGSSESETKLIDISHLDNGVYYLKIKLGDKVVSKKISKI
ncbi:MAG TPA: T9SS type A sorting domain-containing protein [Cytophagaceae bacterium]|jgi:hypothetical protein